MISIYDIIQLQNIIRFIPVNVKFMYSSVRKTGKGKHRENGASSRNSENDCLIKFILLNGIAKHLFYAFKTQRSLEAERQNFKDHSSQASRHFAVL